jgi:hypothetical protein
MTTSEPRKPDATSEGLSMSWWVRALDAMEKTLLADEDATLTRAECFSLLHQCQKLTRPSQLDDMEHAALEAEMIYAGCGSGFATALARAFEAADDIHEHRLGIVFPEFGVALWRQKTKGNP